MEVDDDVSSGESEGDVAPPQEKWRECDRVYTAEKAGMSHVDKELVKKTIYELSKQIEVYVKDTHHFKNEQKKQQQLEGRIERLKAMADSLTHQQLFACTREADKLIARLKETRDLSQRWLCVDMDAFFAAVEELRDPTLKGKPMAVGGISMISTANYEARKYGVRSAMPGFIALKLCPELVFVQHHFDLYQAASNQAREVFRRFDDQCEAASLDEAFLNITNYCQMHQTSPSQVAAELREAVFQETSLTCSVGVAANCMLAKIASNINKPNGQYEIGSSDAEISDFMNTLPVGKVSGIGRVTEQTLKAFGVECGGDILKHRGLIFALFSESTSHFLIQTGLGIGRVTHHEQTPEGEIGRKGLSCERTFQKIDNKVKLLEKMKEICEDVSQHLKKENLRGRTITLKLKSHTFEVRTRAVTLPFYVASDKEIYTHASRLLEAEMDFAPFRLMGIRVSSFQHQDGERQSMITDYLRPITRKLCPHLEDDEFECQSDYICEKCNMECCTERCFQEHCDMHLAEMLQQEMHRLPSIAITHSTPSVPVTRKDSRHDMKKQLTLEQCFKRGKEG